MVGYHKLRARRAGSRRYVDLHVQFRDGTTLERAHELSHELRARSARRLRGADVLIHLEPEDGSEEVHGGGGAHREQHPRIARNSRSGQQDGGDQADADGHPP